MSHSLKDYNLRYARQLSLPDIGKEGQKKISCSSVLIVGAGALGSLVAMQLAGAGVGKIGLADYDTVDISNLQRQFFYSTEQAGNSKVVILAKRILDLNPQVEVSFYKEMITLGKAVEIFHNYDFIVDATDNPESKNIIGRAARECSKAYNIAGIREYTGQVITFLPEDSGFEEYFGKAGAEGFLPCSLSGVFGPAAALCASLQASETLKYITGIGKLLSGRLLVFNLLENKFDIFNLGS